MHAHIAQRHPPILRVDLGVIADEHLEHIRLGAHHGVVNGAAPLRLVDCKGIGALPQQILRASRMPACIYVLSSNKSQVSLTADNDFPPLRLVACKGISTFTQQILHAICMPARMHVLKLHHQMPQVSASSRKAQLPPCWVPCSSGEQLGRYAKRTLSRRRASGASCRQRCAR